MKLGLTPKPNLHGFLCEESKGNQGVDLSTEKDTEIAGICRARRRWRFSELGHRRRSGEIAEGKEQPPVKHPGRRLYAPAAVSPDALKVAPDASGDHRTHAQRGLHFGIAPDDGHRTLALASGASGHAR